MAKYQIRTTMRPAEVVEVEGPEMLDLDRQGLVLPPLPAPAPVAVEPLAADEAASDSAPQRSRKPSNGGK